MSRGTLTPEVVRAIRAAYAARPPLWRHKWAKRVHGCGRGVCQELAERFGIPAKRVSEVGRGVSYRSVR